MANDGFRMFIDRIEYFIENPDDENSLYAMFSAEEKNILRTIRKFEKMRKCIIEQRIIKIDKIEDSNKLTEMIFQKRESERDISFQLKEQMIKHIDYLLKKGKMEAWLDILAWYQLLEGKNLIVDKFWEFPVLATILKAFKKELELYCSRGSSISVLTLHTMQELTDSYFAIVFGLRRIEYDVEPMDELRCCLLEGMLSLTVLETILEEARIFDKRKVRRVIDGWNGLRNG